MHTQHASPPKTESPTKWAPQNRMAGWEQKKQRSPVGGGDRNL